MLVLDQNKRKRLANAITNIVSLVEKCGGKGGKPGPCPKGGYSARANTDTEAAYKLKSYPRHSKSAKTKMISQTKRQKLVLAVDAIIAKCGGPGGKPGRCPGPRSAPNPGYSQSLSERAQKHTQDAHAKSSKLVKEHRTSLLANSHSATAHEYSKRASNAKLAVERKALHMNAAKAHTAAASHHTTSMGSHERAAKHYAAKGDHKLAKQHQMAANAHKKAANSHIKASTDHQMQNFKLAFNL